MTEQKRTRTLTGGWTTDREGRIPLPSFVILWERYEGRRAGDVTVSTAEFALVISLLSLIFLGYSTVRGNKRSDHTDVERRATETATINVKLDQIGGDVKDIKYDITAVKRDVQGLNERMIVVEQSTKSAHHRLDEHVKKEVRSEQGQSEVVD